MLFRTAHILLLMLLVAGLSSVFCQTESPSPDVAKTVQELAKENTISHHTGMNVTEDVPTETLISNGTEAPALAPTPLTAPSGAPGWAPGPTQYLAPGPAKAPSTVPAAAPSAASTFPIGSTSNSSTSAKSLPSKSSPVATPAATSRPLAPTAMPGSAADAGTVGYEKDSTTTKGASIASSSRYGAVAAGTLVAAVVIVGLTGTFMVWKRRSTPYQGLHDTEMAMLRREH